MRRLALGGIVLAIGYAIARAPVIRPSLGGALLASARETAVYRLGPAPARFALPPGKSSLRILVNLDLGPAVPPEGVPYAVRVEIPEDGVAWTFPLVGAQAADRTGAPVAFYLGEAVSPARTREVAVDRGRDGPATAVVSLLGSAGSTASVRLLTLEERPPLARDAILGRLGPEGLLRLASSLGPLDWEQLDGDLREGLLARRWVRAAAEPGTAARRLYLLGPPAPTVGPRLRGQDVGPGRTVAYTVRGPGTLHLVAAEGPLRGRARTLGPDGTSSEVPLALGPGERASLPIGRGPTTVRVSADGEGLVQAVGEATMALDPARARGLPGGEVELEPVWSVETVALALPDPAAHLAFDLAGRGGAEVRISARPLVSPGAGETAFRLGWRILDGRGAALASGAVPLVAPPAPEDRIDSDPDRLLAQPAYAWVWPRAGGERLELWTDRPAALGASSPGFPTDPWVGPAPGLADGILERFRREERPAWFRVRPADEGALWAAGRMLRVRSALRLEERPEPPEPPEVAESLEPLGGPPRFLLLAPVGDPEDPDARAPGNWWPIPANADTPVALAAPPGSPAEARVRPSLIHAGDAALAGREMLVSVDGRVAARVPVFSPRGQVALPYVPAGRHRVRIDPGAPTRLFLDVPVAGSPLHRAYATFELQEGAPLRVRLAKGVAPRSLGVMLYFDGRPSAESRLVARIDGGARAGRPGTASLGWTRLEREAPVRAAAAPGAFYLNRTAGPTWASEPVFVPLHDDLRAGVHEIAISVRNAGARAFARFFSYGASAPAERVTHVGEIHTESPP